MALRSFDDHAKARQFLLDRRCERDHPKRHRTKGRCKKLSAKKRQRVKHYLAARDHKVHLLKARAAAYWAGEADEHP